MSSCELCASPGGAVLWQDELLRVVRVEEAGYPGFCRVIWRAHVAEMTDLSAPQRAHLMNMAWAVETALRQLYQPAKINLASLGNVVPHLHWHVIPRFSDDPHFPRPIWAQALRPAAPRPEIDDATLIAAIVAAMPARAG
jgi:diadenosine tetraphosphate (Ap4A) HIT family hydrolase